MEDNDEVSSFKCLCKNRVSDELVERLFPISCAICNATGKGMIYNNGTCRCAMCEGCILR